MTTVTLWLLISFNSRAVITVNKFYDLAECQRVLTVIAESAQKFNVAKMRCIQAKAVLP